MSLEYFETYLDRYSYSERKFSREPSNKDYQAQSSFRVIIVISYPLFKYSQFKVNLPHLLLGKILKLCEKF